MYCTAPKRYSEMRAKAWLKYKKLNYCLVCFPIFVPCSVEPLVKFCCIIQIPSSETHGQIVGSRESLNGRENVARRKVKNGEKSSSRRSLLFFVPYFSARLDFPSPPLSAPGSPRMFTSQQPHKHKKIWLWLSRYGIKIVKAGLIEQLWTGI